MTIVRETVWIREWETAHGKYIDSKYRTYECDASPEEFLLAWLLGDQSSRHALEIAFEFFPTRLGMEKITRFITVLEGEEYATRLKSTWFGSASQLRPQTLEFLKEGMASGVTERRCVLETRWFLAYWDGFSFYFDTTNKVQETPTHKDYCDEYVRVHSSRLHRDIISHFWGYTRES